MNDSVPPAEGPEEDPVPVSAPDPAPDAVPGEAVECGSDVSDTDPAAPAPLGIPRAATGNADVDARLERLGDADHLATDGHVEVYEDVHRGLRDALTALDARPGPPAPPTTYDPRS
ncbi:hypothetical protein PV396_22975 [Streptomyces sp. ME02-8801-2C]|uniref:hypothetical protein n=1 Tax=Streptomyces sp. ME02-8801-2C TaxID=3028680 RepID=UPI0029AD2F65|nr:hypothetical protein [Streptomyces sp. ME02-8801-2C]MDX3454769.1 hypothetical protein [Streptomyces sp. ME02-8801-2C]